MHDIDDKELELMIKYVCKKYRDELFGDIERNLCLEHYNAIFGLQLTVDNVKVKFSRCKICNKERICVVHPLQKR